MITWAICWLVAKMDGASKGIGAVLFLAMIADVVIVGIVSGSALEIAKVIKG